MSRFRAGARSPPSRGGRPGGSAGLHLLSRPWAGGVAAHDSGSQEVLLTAAAAWSADYIRPLSEVRGKRSAGEHATDLAGDLGVSEVLLNVMHPPGGIGDGGFEQFSVPVVTERAADGDRVVRAPRVEPVGHPLGAFGPADEQALVDTVQAERASGGDEQFDVHPRVEASEQIHRDDRAQAVADQHHPAGTRHRLQNAVQDRLSDLRCPLTSGHGPK